MRIHGITPEKDVWSTKLCLLHKTEKVSKDKYRHKL